MIKRISKSLIVLILGWQVRRLRKRSTFKVVGIAGSIGKTSTKFAVNDVLKQKFRVQFQHGNYNDISSVPLIFFGLPIPSLINPLAWLRTFSKIERQLRKPFPYDVVIVELGTDGKDQIAQFKRYIHCDIAVLTAISLEHMEFFADLDDVAREELEVAKLTDKLVINGDLCDEKYLGSINYTNIKYGLDSNYDYSIKALYINDGEASFTIHHDSKAWLKIKHKALSKAEVYSATAAAVIADLLGLSDKEIEQGINSIGSVSGRMQLLRGINNSKIIDDSYNSSPEAVKAALDSLYSIKAPQKIALLGNMNELGKFSEEAHIEVGKYCDPNQLDLVITIGKDANKYISEYAKKNGCNVMEFNDPYSAGETIKDNLKDGAVVLVKGSQNGVFSEEAIKSVLLKKEDARLLVRQSSDWMKKKKDSFGV